MRWSILGDVLRIIGYRMESSPLFDMDRIIGFMDDMRRHLDNLRRFAAHYAKEIDSDPIYANLLENVK